MLCLIFLQKWTQQVKQYGVFFLILLYVCESCLLCWKLSKLTMDTIDAEIRLQQKTRRDSCRSVVESTGTRSCYDGPNMRQGQQLHPLYCYNRITYLKVKGKSITVQAWRGPEGPRRLRLPDFYTIGTWMWYGCQPYAPVAFTPRKYSWYSFLSENESTPES